MDLELIGSGRLAEVFAWEDGLALKLYRSAERNAAARREAEAAGVDVLGNPPGDPGA